MRKISIVLLSTILLLMPLSACSNGTNASQGDTEETIANDVEEPE